MRVPARQTMKRCLRAAAQRAAALALVAVAGQLPHGSVAAEPVAHEKEPISLAVWMYGFPGEPEYLADLAGSYKRSYGRPVHLYTHDWAESGVKLKQWTGRLRHYAPDMIVVRDADLPLVVSLAVSLEQRFPTRFLREFYPGLLAQGRMEGVLLSLPWMVGPQALYCRSDVLREHGLSPPRTPDELLRVAQEVAEPPDMYGLGLPGHPDGGAAEAFLTTFRAHKGVLFDGRGRLAIGGEQGSQALQWWCDIASSRATQPEVLTWTETELVELFLSGRLAMLIERPWLLRELKLTAVASEVEVVPVPKVEGAVDHLRTDGIVITETARDIEACVHFLCYALGPDQQRALAHLGVPSVRRDAADELPRDRRWSAFRSALRNGRGPSPTAWAEISRIFDRLLFLGLSGRAGAQEAIERIDIELIGEPETEKPSHPPPSPADGSPPAQRAPGS